MGFIIWVVITMLCFPLSRSVEAAASVNDSYDSHLLDEFVQDLAYRSVRRMKSGVLYNISLPSNFTGVEVSFLRLRTGSFWEKGANFSSFDIPRRILPMPYVKRFDLVYENLGNWSSRYYNVPNYTLVAPVVGFMVHNSTNSSRGNKTLNLCVIGKPILVRFPQISVPGESNNVTLQCVSFGGNGTVEFSNMSGQNTCFARCQGHFSVVVPSPPPPPPPMKKKERLWNWWVVGFGVGIVGFVLAALVGVLVYRFVKRRRIKEMERQSERSESLETTWIGRSKMPSATGIRTQPAIENHYVP